MIAYLRSDALTRPTCVTPKATFDDRETGRVTSTIRHGELFVHPRGRPQERYRLRWSPDETERARTLPVGTYTVTGYRHVTKAKDGAEWIWSTTSKGYAEIEVKTGETTPFPVRVALHVKAQALFAKGKHRVGLAFQAEPGLGNTLYRDGKRIGIEWRLLGEKGAVLHRGAMRYG